MQKTPQFFLQWLAPLFSFPALKPLVLSFYFLIFVSSCGIATTRPKLEMSLAASAFLAAKEVKANILAPNLFRKAEIYYIKAKSSYRRKYFNKAKEYALLSQKYSEQAEFVAIRKATLENATPTEP